MAIDKICIKEFGFILDGTNINPAVAIWAIVIVIKMVPPVQAEIDIDLVVNLVYFLSVFNTSSSGCTGVGGFGLERILCTKNPNNSSDVE